MMAVPFILMVAPRGTTKEATSLRTPMRCSTVSRVTGRVALLEEVEKPKSMGARIFRRKIMGDRRVKAANMRG